MLKDLKQQLSEKELLIQKH